MSDEGSFDGAIGSDDRARRLDGIWIAVVIAVLAGRVLTLAPAGGGLPIFSANDRSRWATIRSLGDDGTYAIDALIAAPRNPWDTIDKVAHLGADGRMHYYSSKPTLLPTLLAFEYRLVRTLTGWTLDTHPDRVVRTMLLLSNVLPTGLLLWLTAGIARRRGASDATRGILIAGLGLGTFVGTFVVTINNHLPAAIAVGIGVAALERTVRRRQIERDSASRGASVSDPRSFLVAAIGGAACAFAASCELPALSFAAVASLAFLVVDPRRTLLAFLPAMGLVACAHFGTNWQAHQSFRPAYAHRADGPIVARLGTDETERIARGSLSESARTALAEAKIELSDLWSIEPGESPVPAGVRRWVLTDLRTQERWALVEPKSGDEIEVRTWDNWYEYPGSYWTRPVERRSPVDRGEPSRWRYAWHMTLGHHGILSLTPIFALALWGGALGLGRRNGWEWRAFVAGVATISLVCFLFYLSRPLIDRNYGGQTSVLRWMLWFAPLWMLLSLEAIERAMRSQCGRAAVLTLLIASIASAAYSTSNPWVHPWAYTLFGGE